MRHFVVFLIFVALVVAACDKTKPTMTGRLTGPTALGEFKGCAQDVDSCAGGDQQLLLIANSLSNDLRIFNATTRNFFVAPDPLFPLSIPVGEMPVSLAIDPLGHYAFVVNAVSQNVSLVELVGTEDGSLKNKLVEVDADLQVEGSRFDLRPDINTDVQPEFIVAPQPTDPNWDPQKPLPVYVSLLIETGSTTRGYIAVLNFQYPDATVTPAIPQKLTLQTLVDIGLDGSMPSGLALTKDGSTLFVADEGKDSESEPGTDHYYVHMIDTATNTVTKHIDVAGPSRQLKCLTYVDPITTTTIEKLYVVHSAMNESSGTGEISVVGVQEKERCAPCNAGCVPLATDALVKTIALPNVPRSVTFIEVPGLTVDGASYAMNGQVITHFAWVSNLDGDVYVIDAENNCAVVNKENYIVRFVPSVLAGLAGDLTSLTCSKSSADDCRIFVLFEGSNAMIEFFPTTLSSTSYLLYQ
jgi:DNA-binding beta-propeller fold protein YncE